VTSDSLDTRVARLEQRLDDTIMRMDARMTDLATDVRALSPLVIAHAEMSIRLSATHDEAKKAHAAIDHLEERLDAREETQRKERKRDRQWLVGAIFLAATLVIGAVGLLVNP
jgi:hypothetical protein